MARYARTHGPFTTSEVAARFGLPLERAAGALAALETEQRVSRGEFRPLDAASGARTAGVEWCDVEVLRQLRRRSLAALRKEVEPVEPEAYARFLQSWHGVPADRRGADALVEALGQLQGAALLASTLESEIGRAHV